MRSLVLIAALTAGMLSAATGVSADIDEAKLASEAKATIKKFGGALKKELQSAMKSGGPVAAINVCSEKAPAIAAAVSASSGWTVARSSHKLRNPGNAPDAYTAAAIKEFLERQGRGEAAANFVKAGIVEEGGRKLFRFVKAIPTQDLCVACHGGNQVDSKVAAKLAEIYPEDKARGFKAGEMRGVFTLIKQIR